MILLFFINFKEHLLAASSQFKKRLFFFLTTFIVKHKLV